MTNSIACDKCAENNSYYYFIQMKMPARTGKQESGLQSAGKQPANILVSLTNIKDCSENCYEFLKKPCIMTIEQYTALYAFIETNPERFLSGECPGHGCILEMTFPELLSCIKFETISDKETTRLLNFNLANIPYNSVWYKQLKPVFTQK
jgi:hypothetical protein